MYLLASLITVNCPDCKGMSSSYLMWEKNVFAIAPAWSVLYTIHRQTV